MQCANKKHAEAVRRRGVCCVLGGRRKHRPAATGGGGREGEGGGNIRPPAGGEGAVFKALPGNTPRTHHATFFLARDTQAMKS